MNFSELGLNPSIVKALTEEGYEKPTAVQNQAIPAALAGGDLLVSSQTGSGKTAAFMLPSLERLAHPPKAAGTGPRVLVLTPTRELAQQVKTAAETYSKHLRRVRTVCVVGGTAYPQQLRSLKAPFEVLVATPGRLLDLATSGRIDFSRLEVLVLDEADRMLDMGFIDDIEAIAALTPSNRQTLLFSATLDGVVGKLAQRVTHNGTRIEIAAAEKSRPKITQKLLYADDFGHKNRLLDALLRDTEIEQAVVFTSTKRSADDLADNLSAQGYATRALHGDMSQRERNRTLTELRRGQVRVLVATDVAARGIDVPGISHVINFDLPRQVEDYVHRIGRTGRAGREGIAISLAAHGEVRQVRNIERYTTQQITETVIAGLEPSVKPRKPSGGAGRPRQGGERSFGGGNGRGYGAGNGNGNGNGNRGFNRDGNNANRSFADRNNGERSFVDRNSGERSFADRGERTFNSDRSGGNEQRSFGNRGNSQPRSFNDDRQPAWLAERAPSGERKSGFGAPRANSFGDRSGQNGNRSEGGPRKQFSEGGNRGGFGGNSGGRFDRPRTRTGGFDKG
jgi:superfamily II DNA/RNA helicase